jgi:hypothetical protein
LNDYEYRQKQILLENAELKKVLQQMKKEMISLLSPQKKKPRERADDSTGAVSGLFSLIRSSDCLVGALAIFNKIVTAVLPQVTVTATNVPVMFSDTA